jgi:heptosyltransferase-2
MSQPQEILVRGPNWTGDLIMSTPGFRALRSGFPKARLTLHVRPELLPLVNGAPWFDELLPLDSYRKGTAALVREACKLRARRFDLGLCLPDSFSSALLMRLGGVRRIVGYRRNARGVLLHHPVVPPRADGGRLMIAREQHVLGLVAALGCSTRGTQLELHVTDAEDAEVARKLAEQGARDGDPIALLAPGASYGPSKVWPPAHFARVGDALAAAGASVLLVGTPAERKLSRQVVTAMKEASLDLTGELGIGALKALVRRARVLVCNDAGSRHIAVAFGVPCVVVMGPTSLEKTNLNLERVTVLSADVDCRPCYLRECPIDHRCMTRVSAERVARAALPALAADARERWRGEVVNVLDEPNARSEAAGASGADGDSRGGMA